MTNDELDRLEALAKYATPGPWKVADDASGFQCVVADTTVVGTPPRQILREPTTMGSEDTGEYGLRMGGDDFTFIAASRDAVPALVAEVRRLKEANELAFQRGFNAGAAQLSRSLKEVGKL